MSRPPMTVKTVPVSELAECPICERVMYALRMVDAGKVSPVVALGRTWVGGYVQAMQLVGKRDTEKKVMAALCPDHLEMFHDFNEAARAHNAKELDS